MSEYKLWNPERKSYVTFEYDGEGRPDASTGIQLLQSNKDDALIELSKGAPKTPVRSIETPYIPPNPYGVNVGITGKEETYTRPVEIDTTERDDWYKEFVPKALGINSYDFTLDGEGSGVDRAKADFLRNDRHKKQWMEQEYGPENVAVYNVGGKHTFFYKDPKEKDAKWKFFDSPDVNGLDFTSDISADVIPFLFNMGTTVFVWPYATLATAPATGPGAPIAGGYVASTAGNVAEFGAGVVQDQIAAEALGVDIKSSEILAMRATDLAINQGTDAALGFAGKLLPSFKYGQAYSNQVAKEQTAFYETVVGPDGRIPLYVQRGSKQGEAGTGIDLDRAANIASKYPNGATAKQFTQAREKAVTDIRNEFGANELTEAEAEVILRESVETMTQQYDDDLLNAKNSLKGLKEEEATIKAQADSIPKRVSDQAEEAFELAKQKRIEKLTTRDSKPINQQGVQLIDINRSRYIQLEGTRTRMFDNVYTKLDNVRVNISDVIESFNTVGNKARTAGENELLPILMNSSEKYANRVITSLDEVAEDQIGFRQLNKLIQEIELKINRDVVGQDAAGPSKIDYTNLANQLRGIRDDILESPSVSDATRSQFDKANDFFKNTILPYRKRPTFKFYKPEGGQRYDAAIAQNAKGEQFTLPRLDGGGNGEGYINFALQNVANLKMVLQDGGNSPEVRKALGNAWLRLNGLSEGSAINVGKLKEMSDADLEMASILFPGRGKAEFSQKVQSLIDLDNLVRDKDGFIEGISPELHRKIMSAEDPVQQDKLLKIAQRQIEEQNKIDEVTSKVLVNLQSKGEIPTFSNQFTIESYMSSLFKDGVTIKQFNQLLKEVKEKSPADYNAYKRAAYDYLVNRSGGGTNYEKGAQKAFGEITFDPIQMLKNLEDNREKLISLLGENAFNKIKSRAKSMREFSVTQEKAAGKFSIAGNPIDGSGTPFFSDLGGVANERWTQAMLMIDDKGKNPFNKKLVSRNELFQIQSSFYLRANLGVDSALMLADMSEADPRFRMSLLEEYAGIFQRSFDEQLEFETRLNELKMLRANDPTLDLTFSPPTKTE